MGGSKVVIQLSPIGAKALSASGQPNPDRLAKTLSQSIEYYLLKRDSKSTGWAYPKFLPPGTDSEQGGVEVPLERGLWDEMALEADRQEVAVDHLLQHAALYFAAARDAGRLTDRIIEVLDETPPRK